jgi:hypothetical protein
MEVFVSSIMACAINHSLIAREQEAKSRLASGVRRSQDTINRATRSIIARANNYSNQMC